MSTNQSESSTHFLTTAEWEAVIVYNRQKQYDYAQKEDYQAADYHKQRLEHIFKIMGDQCKVTANLQREAT
jgi:hypothetical protein